MVTTVYRDPQGRFSFDVPDAWKVQSLGDQGANATDGTAYVMVLLVPGGGKDQQKIQRVINGIGGQWKSLKLDSRGQATLSGHQGIYLLLKGDNPKGLPAVLRVTAAPFGDDAYMLLFSAPSDQFPKYVDKFQHVEGSFTVGGTARNSNGDNRGAGVATPNGNATGGGALPAKNAPGGFHAADGPAGGRVLYCAVDGMGDVAGVFQKGINRARGYFDATPRLLSAVTSKDGRVVMVVFSATLGSHPVNGLMTAAYDPEGASGFAIAFDDPAHLSKSLPALMEQAGKWSEETVEKARPTGGEDGLPDFARYEAESKKVTLKRITFPDKTASVGLAPGFTPKLMDKGVLFAQGEDGAYLRMYAPLQMLDPRGTLYQTELQVWRNRGGRGPVGPPGQIIVPYDPDPIRAWKSFLTENNRLGGTPDPRPQVLRDAPMPGTQKPFVARLMAGKMTLQGQPWVFTGMVMGRDAPLPKEGGWFVQLTILCAPETRVDADMPTLLAMHHSLQVDMGAVRDKTMAEIRQNQAQTARWLAANRASGDATRNRRFASSMANARASRDAMDRSTRGFINYISDSDVVEDGTTGRRATVDKNYASALQRADPQRFSNVPVSRYVKGVDY